MRETDQGMREEVMKDLYPVVALKVSWEHILGFKFYSSRMREKEER